MEPIGFLVIAGIVTSIIGLSTFFSKKYKIKRKLKGMGRTPIAQFKHGSIGKVVGSVSVYEDILTAPLSGRECVYYQVKVMKKDDDSWTTVFTNESSVPFILNDGNRKALIHTHQNKKGYLVKDIEMQSGFLRDASQKIEDYLRSQGHSSKGFLGFNKTMKYMEGVIHPGEVVAVMGKGEWEMKPDPDEQMLIMKGDESFSLYISDDTSTL